MRFMAKTKLTLNVDDDLIQRMKFQALREKRSVSQITEQLYTQYLKKHEGKADR
jgi:plasmid stability protein